MAGIFSRRHHVQPGSEVHSASYPTGIGDSSSEVKRPEREAKHSFTSTAGVKNALSFTSTPLICLHCMVLNKAQDASSRRGA
jgi:hypothetical protein